MSCFAIMCAINYASHRPLGLDVGACSNHKSVQETHKACLLSSIFPSLLSSFFPSILPSSLLSQVTVWIVWYFKNFEYIRFWNHFWKKKTDSIHCHLSWPSFYNPSSYFSADESSPIPANLNSFFKWEFMSYYAKLRSVTSSALPLSVNVVIWYLSNWVSFDMISSVETQPYLQVFYLYTGLYILYRYFLPGCPLL